MHSFEEAKQILLDDPELGEVRSAGDDTMMADAPPKPPSGSISTKRLPSQRERTGSEWNSRQRYTCRSCGGVGHNIRTCTGTATAVAAKQNLLDDDNIRNLRSAGDDTTMADASLTAGFPSPQAVAASCTAPPPGLSAQEDGALPQAHGPPGCPATIHHGNQGMFLAGPPGYCDWKFGLVWAAVGGVLVYALLTMRAVGGLAGRRDSDRVFLLSDAS
ncbi:hypothetical protein EDC01DRAFT_635247 [Geopyxis carbonaria]|nr:hypothetical protein EDC01DRAFT_635247 [Geopyxis carbonaria]